MFSETSIIQNLIVWNLNFCIVPKVSRGYGAGKHQLQTAGFRRRLQTSQDLFRHGTSVPNIYKFYLRKVANNIVEHKSISQNVVEKQSQTEALYERARNDPRELPKDFPIPAAFHEPEYHGKPNATATFFKYICFRFFKTFLQVQNY